MLLSRCGQCLGFIAFASLCIMILAPGANAAPTWAKDASPDHDAWMVGQEAGIWGLFRDSTSYGTHLVVGEHVRYSWAEAHRIEGVHMQQGDEWTRWFDAIEAAAGSPTQQWTQGPQSVHGWSAAQLALHDVVLGQIHAVQHEPEVTTTWLIDASAGVQVTQRAEPEGPRAVFEKSGVLRGLYAYGSDVQVDQVDDGVQITIRGHGSWHILPAPDEPAHQVQRVVPFGGSVHGARTDSGVVTLVAPTAGQTAAWGATRVQDGVTFTSPAHTTSTPHWFDVGFAWAPATAKNEAPLVLLIDDDVATPVAMHLLDEQATHERTRTSAWWNRTVHHGDDPVGMRSTVVIPYNTDSTQWRLTLDQTPPTITGVDVFVQSSIRAVVNVTTSEYAQVRLDLHKPDGSIREHKTTSWTRQHHFPLIALQPNSTYAFSLQATDLAGLTTNRTGDQFHTASEGMRAPIAVTEPFPADGAILSAPVEEIRVRYASDNAPIDTSRVRLFVDKTEVSALADIGPEGLIFRPAEALGPGTHTVNVEVRDIAGGTGDRVWRFTVEETGGSPGPGPVLVLGVLALLVGLVRRRARPKPF